MDENIQKYSIIEVFVVLQLGNLQGVVYLASIHAISFCRRKNPITRKVNRTPGPGIIILVKRVGGRGEEGAKKPYQ